MDIPPLAVSFVQAAACCGVGRSSLYEAIADGRLKTRKLGRRTLVEVEALKAFIAGLPATVNDGKHAA